MSAAVLAGVALYGVSGASHGLGFGRPTSRAVLGETLTVTVPVSVESANDIASECVAADVYFGDDKLAGAEVAATLLPGSGRERVIKVTTRKFVNEPVVTVYLAAGCTAKVSRKFVTFADPPGAATPSVAFGESESPTVAYSPQAGRVTVGGLNVETSGSSTIAAAPANDAVPAAPAVRRTPRGGSAGHASHPKGSAGGTARSADVALGDTSQGTPTTAVSSNAQAMSARPLGDANLAKASNGGKAAPARRQTPSGERLMLDPADADAMVQPNLTMSPGLQGKPEGDDPSAEVKERRLAAAALWMAMNATPEQLARDQQRVQELEKRLASLKQESDRSRREVAALQAQVRQTESAQSNTGLVYGLGALAALLGAALIGLVLKGRSKSTGSDWWTGTPVEPAEGGAIEPSQAAPSGEVQAHSDTGLPKLGEAAPASSPVVPMPMPVAPPVTPAQESAPTFDLSPTPPTSLQGSGAETTARPQRPALTEPPREVSVEELIDLEQQAEFFIVLGQDDAALDLLESHVQSTTGASPLPFLKLLEIYQRLGKRQDYERVQSEFNARFNGYAPAWESDLTQGHSLPEYPGIVERLQALWPTPAKAMDVLERSLTRPDTEAETFDLPAYRELLFLYAVARDLSERESENREAVDLSLPFADPTVVSVTPELETIEPLMATRPVKAQPEAQPIISLDLSLDDLAPLDLPPSILPASASDLPPLTSDDNGIEFEHVDLNLHRPPDEPKP